MRGPSPGSPKTFNFMLFSGTIGQKIAFFTSTFEHTLFVITGKFVPPYIYRFLYLYQMILVNVSVYKRIDFKVTDYIGLINF